VEVVERFPPPRSPSACTAIIAEEWGGLHGTDAATLVEVIEHLDPGPLAAAGPALLGGLAPR